MNARSPSLFLKPHSRQRELPTLKQFSAVRRNRLPREPTLVSIHRIRPQLPRIPRTASNSEHLHLDPQNHIFRCAYKSQQRTSTRNNQRVNQDDFLVMPHLQHFKHQYLFAVFDGHGTFGDEISGQAKRLLQSSIEEYLLRTDNQSVLVSALTQAIDRTAHTIETLNLNAAYSGTTLTAVLVSSKDVICANVGDSRAVLGKLKQSKWVGVDLTRDHKPSLSDEKARITAANGKIYPFSNEKGENIGPERVWVETGGTPGLAMSRSIGDLVAHSVGVSAEPEISKFTMSSEDKFLIIATDGLWEVMSTQEAVEFVGKELANGLSDRCCTELIRQATAKWGQSADDITIILVFLS